MKRVLNVGGGASRELPPIYRGWEQTLLDVDPNVEPDVCLDAKEMTSLPAAQYDSVFSSHTLEHFYGHEVPLVLRGFWHVLRPSGFAHVSVPDLQTLMECVVGGNREIDETWYRCGGGSITFLDVLYGWSKPISKGNLFYAHHTGFTARSLTKALRAAGFKSPLTAVDGAGNLHAYGFKRKPDARTLQRLGI